LLSPFAGALVRARPKDCRFPVKSGGICGEYAEDGVYCGKHQRVAFTPSRK
jgi:hypothetical protein